MRSSTRRSGVLVAVAAVLAAAGAQVVFADTPGRATAAKAERAPTATAAPIPTTCNGPTVNADRTITFCVTAPQANSIQLNFQNMLGLSPAADAYDMAKTATGIWHVTIGPLDPNWYGYGFSIDGARVADPANRNIWSLDRSAWSNVMVPGPGTEFMAETSVAHGAVSTVSYYSKVTASQRRMTVYTPPGYDRSHRDYPVFYLLHGGGGNDTDWVANMRANFILDNLIARKRIAPMIVVMPDMNVGAGEQSCARSLECAAPDELMRSVIPYTEKTYRVARGVRNRALAGLSVGGDVVRNTLLHHPNAFTYAGFFSGGQMPPEVVTDLTENHVDLIRSLARSKTLRLLWISFGGTEALVSNHQHWEAETERVFDEFGVDYTYVDGPTFGAIHGHVWDTWRKDLFVFAPRLFRR